MNNQVNARVGCHLVGEYVDEGDCPANPASRGGEVVRTQVVAEYLDHWTIRDIIKEFTVLLKDGRVVAVCGHSLRHSPNPVTGQDVYSVVIRTPSDEVLVALFKCEEVAGIFHGEIRSDRKIA